MSYIYVTLLLMAAMACLIHHFRRNIARDEAKLKAMGRPFVSRLRDRRFP